MKILSLLTLFFLSVLFFVSEANAAKVEVQWNNPDKYRDINPGDNNRKAFQARVFKNFEKHFSKLAAKLPADQILKININDLDLAGDVHHGGISRIRIVTELFFPRMKFSYQLFNADKTLADSDEINLKDMSFMTGSILRYRNDAFGYDKRMIDNWFNSKFKEQIKH